jgi:hypothetical protein
MHTCGALWQQQQPPPQQKCNTLSIQHRLFVSCCSWPWKCRGGGEGGEEEQREGAVEKKTVNRMLLIDKIDSVDKAILVLTIVGKT